MPTTIPDYVNDDPASIKARIDELKTLTTFTTLQRTEVETAITELQTRVANNPATDLQTTSDSSNILEQKILEAKEDLKISEDRVSTLRNVNKKRSYYESWFPINRPLRSSSIIVCFIFGIFFISLTFFMFMRFFGLSFTIDIAWLTPENMAYYGNLQPYIIGILGLAVISFAIITWVRNS